jgi:hypothetical protein
LRSWPARKEIRHGTKAIFKGRLARVLERPGSPPHRQGRSQRPCPCDSGKKYKDCHEREGSAFLEKLARKQDKVRLREVRQHLKEKGVPWYKRIFVRL